MTTLLIALICVACFAGLRWLHDREVRKQKDEARREALVKRIWQGDDKRLALFVAIALVLQASVVVFCEAKPDPVLTPGVVRPLTQQQVCSIKWGADRRHVTEAMKQQVAKSYAIDRRTVVAKGKGPCCEFDHLVPREVGGADDVKNLWLQPWDEASVKDVEENQFHKDVCAGKVSLTAAQLHFMRWGQ